jgi:hypothetical protein
MELPVGGAEREKDVEEGRKQVAEGGRGASCARVESWEEGGVGEKAAGAVFHRGLAGGWRVPGASAATEKGVGGGDGRGRKQVVGEEG